jgi:amino acid adenylation domain-containing protein
MPGSEADETMRDARTNGQVGLRETLAGHWPPVLVPADRPRLPGVPARCSAVLAAPRAEFGDVPRGALLAGFAAILFRYTGQALISVSLEAERIRYVVSGEMTLLELAASGERGPGFPDDAELRLAVHPGQVELHYDAGLFDEATIARMLGHFQTLVQHATRSRDCPVKLLRLLPDDEAHRMLIEWNRTDADLPYDTCLHQAFEAQAARAPQAIAIVHRGERWTYERVNTDANHLAHHLRSLGVGPDSRVGLCLDRSPALLIAMLGAMKAGGAYVPLDPGYPAERLATMVRGSSCAVIISRAGLVANLPATTQPMVLLDRDAQPLAALPGRDPAPLAGPGNLCYVIHTSGSTGTPKPAALRHRGVMNNLADLNARCQAGPGDSVLALSSPSFDMSVYEFLGITTAGGTIVIPDQDRGADPAHWAELLIAERVTIWNSAPALLGLLVEHLEGNRQRLPALRVVMLGGDWTPVTLPGRVRAVAPGARVIVFGGNVEASIQSTSYEVGEVDPAWRSIPYGRPLANQRTYILDEARQPVPPGVPGELCLAGIGLAREYLNRPEETAARFVEWSYGEVSDRLYRTGDLARFAPDGMIELLGRMDFQVKVNGMRVELGEIESVLRRHERVRQVAVAARDGRLVAYVVPAGSALATESLRDLAARWLPEYMVPAVFVQLDELPLTPNGKLDRKGLPEPEVAGAPYRAPRSAAERVLAAVYADVLGLARVGLDDDFIEMGGDSVRAIQAVSRARARGIELSAREILQSRTIAAIRPAMTARPPAEDAEDAAPLVVAGADERAELARRYPGLAELWPLTPMQSGMLLESLLGEAGPGVYLMQTVYHLSGTVDPARMRAAGQALLERHASLRAAFVVDVTDAPVQVVVGGLEPLWREVDLSDQPADAREEAFGRFLAQDRARQFDLAVPPLWRLALVTFSPRHARLVLTVHHLLVDGWSEQVLASDIVGLYADEAAGPARPYRDFLAWLARQDREAHARAWLRELHGTREPTLLAPAGTARGQAADAREVVLSLAPGDLAHGTRRGITASILVQGAWAIVLAALTGRDDVVFGAIVSGRPGELTGVESMVGLFINTVPVRVSVNPYETVSEFLDGLQRKQLSLLDHQHHSLAEIHQALGVSVLFDTLVAVQTFPAARGRQGEVKVTQVDSLGHASYPLAVIVEDERLTVQYDRNVIDPAAAQDIATRLRLVVSQLARGDDQPIDTLEDLPPTMARPAGAAAAGREYREARTPREEALCELFAEVLDVERVGIDDNLFALGCNSLMATRIVSRMRRSLRLETSVATIFQYPTVAELSGRVKTAKAQVSLRKATAER